MKAFMVCCKKDKWNEENGLYFCGPEYYECFLHRDDAEDRMKELQEGQTEELPKLKVQEVEIKNY